MNISRECMKKTVVYIKDDIPLDVVPAMVANGHLFYTLKIEGHRKLLVTVKAKEIE